MEVVWHAPDCTCEDCLPACWHEERAVLEWRLHQLVELEFAYEDARVLALDPEVDIEVARRLIGANCPLETARRILQPL